MEEENTTNPHVQMEEENTINPHVQMEEENTTNPHVLHNEWLLNSWKEEEEILRDKDMTTKMDHLMHSDTMILVVGLLVMIIVGLVFRTLCLRLSNKNSRKERMRGGLKLLGENMNYVTRAMSNDLDLPNSPKTVMRTYSNYGRTENVKSDIESPAPIRREEFDSIRMQAFSNNLRQECPSISLQVSELDRAER